MSKLPYLPFYPSDWKNDLELQICSLAARGLMIELMGLMHYSERYGHLLINSKIPSIKCLAIQVRSDYETVNKSWEELVENNVIKFTKNKIPYSSRMVEDHKKRLQSKEYGAKGGNPKLLKGKDKSKDNRKDNPKDKQKLEYEIEDVIKYLNLKTNKKFRLTDTNKGFISSRLNDYSLDDIKTVIDKKTKEWMRTNQEVYLRPKTLFTPDNFDSYLNQPDKIGDNGKRTWKPKKVWR